MPQAKRKQQIEDLLENIHAINHSLTLGNHSCSHPNDVTLSQWMVLRAVKQNEGMGVKEIAGLLGVTSSAATQLVTGLVKKGYLDREGSQIDRRALQIKLTDRTKEQINAIRSDSLSKLTSLLKAFNDEELRLYCELNNRIAYSILKKQTTDNFSKR